MDQFDVAMRAHEAGKYAVALRLLLPLAEAGNAEAQFSLGQLYREGHGVARDDKVALKWYRKAARQGDAKAQGALGAMY